MRYSALILAFIGIFGILIRCCYGLGLSLDDVALLIPNEALKNTDWSLEG